VDLFPPGAVFYYQSMQEKLPAADSLNYAMTRKESFL